MAAQYVEDIRVRNVYNYLKDVEDMRVSKVYNYLKDVVYNACEKSAVIGS